MYSNLWRPLVTTIAALIVAVGLVAGAASLASAQTGDGNPDVSVGSNSNGGVVGQTGDQDQNSESGQFETVGQNNPNSIVSGSSLPGESGGAATTGCDTGEVSDDAVSCEAGGATVGDSSTGDATGANTSDQSGSNSSDQKQASSAGGQSNTPDASVNQDTGTVITGLGGDVDNSVVTTIDDNSDDDVTDNEGGTIDRSQDNDVIEGDGNQVNLLDELLAELTNLLERVLRERNLGGPTT